MKRLSILTLATVLLAACTSQLGPLDLTAANNGEAIEATPNQLININLDSNITTGYKWNLVTEPNDKIVKLVSSSYNAPASGKVGAGGTETWQFQTVGTGTTALKLSYFRPFDPQKEGAKEYAITVTVK